MERIGIAIPPRGKLTDDWPADQAELVGRILIAFSQLEWVLYLFPKRLRGERLIDYQDWPDRFGVEDRCRQIETEAATMLSAGLAGQLIALVARIRAVNEGDGRHLGRNDLAHGPWVTTPEGQKLLVGNGRGHTVQSQDLMWLLTEVRAMRDELNCIRCPKLTTAQKSKLRVAPKLHHYKPRPSD